MGYRRLFIVRKDLNLSPGKLAVQLSHCSESYWLNLIRQNAEKCKTQEEYRRIRKKEPKYKYASNVFVSTEVFDEYITGDMVKTVCEANDLEHLKKAAKIAKDLFLREDVDFGFINDLCLTELTPENPDGTCTTAFWTAPLPDVTAHAISKKYQLYR